MLQSPLTKGWRNCPRCSPDVLCQTKYSDHNIFNLDTCDIEYTYNSYIQKYWVLNRKKVNVKVVFCQWRLPTVVGRISGAVENFLNHPSPQARNDAQAVSHSSTMTETSTGRPHKRPRTVLWRLYAIALCELSRGFIDDDHIQGMVVAAGSTSAGRGGLTKLWKGSKGTYMSDYRLREPKEGISYPN